MNITPIAEGSRLTFKIKRLVIDENHKRSYEDVKYSGKVMSIDRQRSIEQYRVKVHKKNEYFIVPRHRVLHVWYVV